MSDLPTPAAAAGDALSLAIILVGPALVYFLPPIIAALRKRRSVGAIFATTLFFGWTIIGWAVAFIWALTDGKERVVVVREKEPA